MSTIYIRGTVHILFVVYDINTRRVWRVSWREHSHLFCRQLRRSTSGTGCLTGFDEGYVKVETKSKIRFESSLFGENTFWARCKVSFQFLCSLQCHELLLYYLFVLTAFQRVESFYSSFPKFKTKGRNSIKNHFSIFLKVCTLSEHFAKVSVVSTLSMVSLPRIRSHRCSQALKQSLRTLEPKIPRFGVHGSCHH